MIPYQVQDLKALLRSDLHSDITFLVDGHKITAHKVRTFQSVLTPTICFLLVKKKRNPICNKMGILSYEFFEFRNLKFSEFWNFRMFLFLCSNFSFFDFLFFPYFRIFSILIFTVHLLSFLFYFLFYLFICLFIYLFIYSFIHFPHLFQILCMRCPYFHRMFTGEYVESREAEVRKQTNCQLLSKRKAKKRKSLRNDLGLFFIFYLKIIILYRLFYFLFYSIFFS